MRVVIVEDNVLLAEGLRLLLDLEGATVVAVLHTADEFLPAVDEHAPDVAIMDVRLPPTYRDEGVRAAAECRRRRPGFPVLVLSQYVEHVYSAELLRQGAGGVGYLLKDRVSRVDEFLGALRRVAAGGTAIDPEVIEELLRRQHRDGPLERLTARELEVLSLMAQGHSNGAIATLLAITERSVSKHIGNVFAKLGLPADDNAHRRVRAVLTFLNASSGI
ncbi:MAG: response regulator transcription factor [Dactylosporangium sp.]|nr:response regulator transcription factor [Dactylosporangium sp.]NNJ61336.1 response regulator transcription factor [Dactylosporangium sp.]